MNELHYDAFISYRHTPRDTDVAIEIQHSLEHFRIPKAIQEKTGVNKITRIFRDQEELQLNPDLATKIESALDNSDYLIIICSPDYLKSKWCLLEIDTFLKKHDRDHIFCVLSEGEPPVVFPEQLLHYTKTIIDENGNEKEITVNSEPLACDYRMDFKDARKIELPRLVSAMIGCNYDELVLRQEKYRRKRLFTILASLFMLAVIAISYLLWSNAQISKNYLQALVNESKTLAKESLDYYSKQDRLSAIETALKALPSENDDRPVVDDALYALAKTTYAYTAPFQTQELWRIDNINEISEFFITADNLYLVFSDKGRQLHSYDVNRKNELVSLSLPYKPNNIHEGKKEEVIVCSNEEVASYGYLDGEKKWAFPLEKKTLGKTKLSYSKKQIGVIDSFIFTVLDTDGHEQFSFRLPDGYEGYFADFTWSYNDELVAFLIKGSSFNYKILLLDLNTSKYLELPELFSSVLYFAFDEKGTLYAVDDPGGMSSYDINEFSSVINKKYRLCAYESVDRKFETLIDNSFPIADVEVVSHDEDSFCLILGNGIYQIDNSGNILNSYLMNRSIAKLLNHDSEAMIFVCSDGYQGTFWFDEGSAALNKSFPENFTDIQKILSRLNTLFSHFAVLNEGNLYLYEYSYDDSLEYYSMVNHQNPPEEHLLAGDMVIYVAYDTIGVADLKNKVVIGQYPIDENTYYHLLDTFDDKAYLLKIIAPDGKMSVVCFDLLSQSMESETDLGVYDFDIGYGFYSFPLDRSMKIYTDTEYVYPAALICKNHIVYYHDIEEPNIIRILDLKSGQIRNLELSLDDRFLINYNEKYYYPTRLLVDENGRYLLSSTLGKGFSRSVVLIDMDTNEALTVFEGGDEEFLACLDEERIVYSAPDSLNIYDLKGELLYSIPYTGDRAMTFTYHDGRAYVVYPDGMLRIYEGDKEIRSVELNQKGIFYSNERMIRFDFFDNELFLYNAESLNLINLDSDSSKPLLEISGNVMDYYKDADEFLVYAYEMKKLDLTYSLASYKRYTNEQLIKRANEQLIEYK